MSKNVSEFLLGIDLSCVAIDINDCKSVFENMKRLQWLKLTATGIDAIPKGIETLTQLERLVLSKNQIANLTGDWRSDLKMLRSVDVRKNLIVNENVPDDFFVNPNLQVVDLSFNLLTEVPKGIVDASSLLVLNLSNNQIDSVSDQIFVNCQHLKFLDLSYNQLTTLPIDFRCLPNLKSLNLSHNELEMFELSSVCALKKLTDLYLSHTSLRVENFPADIDTLLHLVDLDISDNLLKSLPETVYKIASLTKLNVSGNEIDELNDLVNFWPNLGILNLSNNKLCALPASITRLSNLKKLYVDGNQLHFDGIPPSIGKLGNLVVFSAAENYLENVPEGLCRCGQLKQLNLRSNRLVTLPDAIQVLAESLTMFNVSDNPNLKMPPKLDAVNAKDKFKYYNLDFSLETQMQLARGASPKSTEEKNPQKEAINRIKRLRHKKLNDSFNNKGERNSDSKCVLEGMKKVAKEKDAILEEREMAQGGVPTSRKWQDSIAKPNLDYSQLFDEDAGKEEGIEIWEIDDFNPRRVQDELMYGSFYDGDCYIVLNTTFVDNKPNWSIHYWIGSHATLDKVTCSAVHAVNLRNYLGAECRCERTEQDDESDEFKALFNGQIEVMEGSRGESGFLIADEKQYKKRLYRLFGGDKGISIYSCDTSPSMLDSKFVYLFDDSSAHFYLWFGNRSRLMLQSKSRLLVDKINQRERKGQSPIIIERDGDESDEFKQSLSNCDSNTTTDWSSLSRDHIPLDWVPPAPKLYDVQLGRGCIEMPQVDLPLGRLKKSLLQDKRVYILEANGDVYVWVGDMTPKFLKFAGYKLAYEMVELLKRASRRTPIICYQSTEPQIFKMLFCDWEDTVAVDFTRSAESMRVRGADINEIMERDKIKIELKSFFMPREKPIFWDEAQTIMEEYNEDIAINENDTSINKEFHVKQFVYINRKWLPVEDRWVGHFFCEDSHFVHVEYWESVEEDVDDEEGENNDGEENRIQTVIYFWQGREASDIPWYHFNMTFKKEMEIRFSGINDKKLSKDKLKMVEFKRMNQQQEFVHFLAHFRHKFVIHLGRYQDRYSEKRKNRIEMFYLRENSNALCTRTVEVKPLISFLNSCFHYILKIPARLSNTDKDQIICWIGKNSDPHYNEVLTSIAEDLYLPEDNASIMTVQEGEEPDIFWLAFGGKTTYDDDCDFLKFTRLFRLSNEQGFFSASEKCSDFCQDDLNDEDAMLLDTGREIYLWFGNRTSEVEKKFSMQAAKLYKEFIDKMQPDRSRALKITTKRREPHLFRRCFHGWGPFKEAKDWSG